ncbi:scavenger receptor cysteine-rich type 1 protein M160-like [Asterias rubens]|uniref:scavenger receptor cysteine-rich type 1 protein M160-like n=1 Tax=Asterias rubens TaxID=7604 RepID=UPI001455009B|nr:scavenger receptor cysteine-rich type 1 protein M160-like [Asterias rubens]
MKSMFVAASVSYGISGSEIVGYLGGGPSRNEGLLQLYIDGTWTTVCNRNWTYEAADFTCEMLGFDGVQPDGWNAADYGGGTGPVWCYSPEQGELMPCPTDGGDICTHSDDVGLRCTWTPEPGDFMHRLGYMFRLTGGDAEQGEGRVEVYLNDEWSTICHYGWSEYFADAVCQHLGFQGVKGSNWNVPYGGGTGPVVCAEIFSLTVCPSDAGGVCTHAQDVGVRCETDEGEADGSEDEGRDMEVVRTGIIAAASVLVAGGVFIPIVACVLAHSQPVSGRSEDCEKMLSSSEGSVSSPEHEPLDDMENEGKLNEGFEEDDPGECSGGTEVKGQITSDDGEGDEDKDRKDINEDTGSVGNIEEGCETVCNETDGGEGDGETGSDAGVCETVSDEGKQNGDRTATPPPVRTRREQDMTDVEGGRDTVEMYEYSMHGEHSLNSVYF